MFGWYGAVLGLALVSSWLILWQVPLVGRTARKVDRSQTVSVIIPARNEASNLPILLEALAKQKFHPFEIIVVDDDSEDQTAQIAFEYGAQVLSFQPDASGWVGKSAACWAGAQVAKGDYLLFLDADIFLPDVSSLGKIIAEFQAQNACGILSVQPYHVVSKAYENLSAVFNLLVLAGMNRFSFLQDRLEPAGAFGPSLLCRRDTYFEVGGHARTRDAIMENVDLGKYFGENNLPVRLYGGKGVLHFRMYPDGLAALIQGWSKSFATASLATHPLIIVGISFLMAGACFAFSFPIYFLLTGQWLAGFIAIVGYMLFFGHFYRLARLAGNFSWQAILAFPILFVFFIGLFIWSFIKTFILRQVSWKGRNISL